jgi:hypothetical protein
MTKGYYLKRYEGRSYLVCIDKHAKLDHILSSLGLWSVSQSHLDLETRIRVVVQFEPR